MRLHSGVCRFHLIIGMLAAAGCTATKTASSSHQRMARAGAMFMEQQQSTGDLDTAATGYIYRQDGNGPASVVYLNNDQVLGQFEQQYHQAVRPLNAAAFQYPGAGAANQREYPQQSVQPLVVPNPPSPKYRNLNVQPLQVQRPVAYEYSPTLDRAPFSTAHEALGAPLPLYNSYQQQRKPAILATTYKPLHHQMKELRIDHQEEDDHLEDEHDNDKQKHHHIDDNDSDDDGDGESDDHDSGNVDVFRPHHAISQHVSAPYKLGPQRQEEHHDQAKEQHKQQHHKDEHAQSHGEQHHHKHGHNDHEDYDKNDEYSRGKSGHHDSADHSSHYGARGEHEQGHHAEADEHGRHEEGADGEKGGKYNEKKAHKKGSKTMGYHNVFHKDEYKKDHTFYDEADHSGNFDKFGREHRHHAEEEGDRKRGGHHESGKEEQHHAKKGHTDRGHTDQAAEGYKRKHGAHSHHRHGEEYAKKGGHHHGEEEAKKEEHHKHHHR